jgi:hypothetical protein
METEMNVQNWPLEHRNSMAFRIVIFLKQQRSKENKTSHLDLQGSCLLENSVFVKILQKSLSIWEMGLDPDNYRDS